MEENETEKQSTAHGNAVICSCAVLGVVCGYFEAL